MLWQSTRDAAAGCRQQAGDGRSPASGRLIARRRAGIAVVLATLWAPASWGEVSDAVRPYAELTYTRSSNLFRLSKLRHRYCREVRRTHDATGRQVNPAGYWNTRQTGVSQARRECGMLR